MTNYLGTTTWVHPIGIVSGERGTSGGGAPEPRGLEPSLLKIERTKAPDWQATELSQFKVLQKWGTQSTDEFEAFYYNWWRVLERNGNRSGGIKAIWDYHDGPRLNLRKIRELGLRFHGIVEQSIEPSFDVTHFKCLGVYGWNLVGNWSVSLISLYCDLWWAETKFKEIRLQNWGFHNLGFEKLGALRF